MKKGDMSCIDRAVKKLQQMDKPIRISGLTTHMDEEVLVEMGMLQ